MNSYLPTRLITGKYCLKQNAELFAPLGTRALLVTGKNSARLCGALEDVIQTLNSQNIIWKQFDEIGQNPLLTDCQRGAQIAQAIEADFIIGIGGGSPLDAAKCIAVLAANPEMTEDELYSLHWPQKPLPVVAVGTTAGTGSEVTKIAVITTPSGRKRSFYHEDSYPAIAFGDYTYTLTLGEEFSRSTAADAFAHCMESYFCRTANEISRTYARRGMEMLIPVFHKIIFDGFDTLTEEDRETCYHASVYGGMAINITGTAFPHTMGYLLTEEFHVSHGTACAVFLPEFYEYNKQTVPELCAKFLSEIPCSEEELLTLLSRITPECRISLSEQDISDSDPRWENNNSLKKCWGNFDGNLAKQVLRKKFLLATSI